MAHLKLADYYLASPATPRRRSPRSTPRIGSGIASPTARSTSSRRSTFSRATDFEQSRDSLKVLTDALSGRSRGPLRARAHALRARGARSRRSPSCGTRSCSHPHGARAHGTLALLLARDNQPAEALDGDAARRSRSASTRRISTGRAASRCSAPAGCRRGARRLRPAGANAPVTTRISARLSRRGCRCYAGDICDGAMARLGAALIDSSPGAAGARVRADGARAARARAPSLGGDRGARPRPDRARSTVSPRHDQASPVELHDSGADRAARRRSRRSRSASSRAWPRSKRPTPTPLVRGAPASSPAASRATNGSIADAPRLQDDALRAAAALSRYSRGARRSAGGARRLAGAAAAWQSRARRARDRSSRTASPRISRLARARLTAPAHGSNSPQWKGRLRWRDRNRSCGDRPDVSSTRTIATISSRIPSRRPASSSARCILKSSSR